MVWLVCMIFFSTPLPAFQEENIQTGVTTGSSRIVGNDIQNAKQEAVKEALNVAVQNGFADLVSRQVVASNLEYFYNQILSKSSEYIITYRVINGIENRGKYIVAVESRLDLSLLEKQLVEARVINDRQNKPVVMFFILEKLPSDILPRYWWGNNPLPYQSIAENRMIGKMSEMGFTITGNEDPRPEPSFYNISFGNIYDVQSAIELGRHMKADIIVFGKADAREAINRMGEEKTFNGQVDVSIYKVETGEKLFVTDADAAAKSNDENLGSIQALSEAADMAALELAEKINAYWKQTLRQERAFDLNIEGDNFLPRFIALKQKLNQMPGIENMQPKEMGGSYAVLEILYKGTPSRFADVIMLKTFDSFGLEISEVSDQSVNIRFIEKMEEGEALKPEQEGNISVESSDMGDQ